MEFQVLSHAGLKVSAGSSELICDPWLLGSTYWRSWWNYPPVPRSLIETLKPDFIYLTHLHWDHFQSASLRQFDPQTPIYVPYDRRDKMVRDLHSIGRTNVREIRHGEKVQLSDKLAITAFQMHPLITDSALVIEADGQVLLNVNDAKLAWLPLAQVLARFPSIDFCFRSHSSANPRACYHLTDAPGEEAEDNERYVRAFALFMARVKPRFAIPFASNNCFLHEEAFEMNRLAQTPYAVRDFFEPYARRHGLSTEIKVMISGDRWSSEDGFHLQAHDWFENRDGHLAVYRARVAPTMARQAALEATVAIPLRPVQTYFARLSRDIPAALMRSLWGQEVLLVARSEKAVTGFAVDLPRGLVRQVEPAEFARFDMRIEFPAVILRQAIVMNMFGHAGISKRVHFHASRASMPTLKRFVTLLEFAEAEIFPLRRHFTARTLRAVLPRWREGLLYLRAAIDLQRGLDGPTIEERYLDPFR